MKESSIQIKVLIEIFKSFVKSIKKSINCEMLLINKSNEGDDNL